MVYLITLPECTTGVETWKAVMNELSIRQIDISNVISITMDVPPSIIGKAEEFVNQFVKHVGHSLIGLQNL